MWYVYRHTSPSNKVYIGITSTSPEKRWRYGTGYSNCTLFQKAINKYGWNNIQHEVLFHNCSEELAKKLEIAFIKYYKNLNLSYNITDGGDGHLGVSWVPSQKTRDLWSLQRKGKIISKEQRAKLSKALKGRPTSSETKEKLSKIFKGKNGIPVLQLSLDGQLIREFSSIGEAARALNIKYKSDITRCCEGKRKSRAGFKWKYKEF